ncbi:extracellular solute-binding protein [Paenibacillus glycanilyticus]|uniref:ABC transporter peptide-binding protein YtcQ n=1 Tax=Paenibacillus glycanilyticus TaxID=126569 RepID=A0ABQ6G713_9BACL|nr:extracellular solute-binding protein [Paenibacillus glycanilyticus]GLX65785.1 putative ABC transporter peptide-binding protein YtcQ [Paenibacillus glycanilyticus]
MELKKAKAKVKGSAMLSLLLLMTTVTACTNSDNGNASTNASNSPSATTSTEGSPAASTNSVPNGPEGKYDPPIEVTTVRSLNQAAELAPGDTYDENIWTKTFESDLGIKVKNTWKVNAEQYQNKIAVTMASGDMPDFMNVDAQQFQILVQAGTIADLTDVYAKYASDLTKSSFEGSNSLRLKAATIDGKIMGIPADGGEAADTQLIYIRKDWLNNLGLQPPKTMDDVINIAMAFTKNDPDKNGKNDTYGLSLDNNLFNGWSGLDGFFNGYHAYPFNPTKGTGTSLNFIKGADGKAQWADVQPEVKTALGKLADLFKQGAIYPEFSVIDGNKSAELVTSGKVGMTFGAFWVPTWPINNMYKDVPGADWGIYPLVSSDDQPALSQSMGGLPSHYFVVSKKSKHPEAPFLLLNTYIEKIYGHFDKNYHTVTVDGKDYGEFGLAPINGGLPGNNPRAAAAVQAAKKSGDTSALNDEQKNYYDQVAKFEAGDATMWAANKLWAEGGVFSLLGQYVDNKQVFTSTYVGNPTPTMIAKGPSLRDEEVKMMTSIIMGSKPLDYFDEWAANWLASGGQSILDEVNASGMVQ